MERFLREQGWKHQGSLPLLEASLEELGNRLGQFFEGSGLSRGIPDGLFPCGLREAFRKRGYWAMEDLLGYYLEVRRRLLPKALRELEELLLAIHDAYIRERNQESRPPEPFSQEHTRSDGEGGKCRQCGQCCKGPASGPLSSSPIDLALWEKLGREDLLYYTLRGAWRPSEKSVQQWAACPFLRFSARGDGVCLVHPVKPIVCREFLCG